MPKKLKKELDSIPATPGLATYCPDLATWPTSWCGEERDAIPGKKIVTLFTPFLLELLAQGLSPKTRNLHRDNLWQLGGEIIRNINDRPKLRKRPVKELILNAISNDEGPLLSGGFSEQEQRSFDSTCKKLNRFLTTRTDKNSL